MEFVFDAPAAPKGASAVAAASTLPPLRLTPNFIAYSADELDKLKTQAAAAQAKRAKSASGKTAAAAAAANADPDAVIVESSPPITLGYWTVQLPDEVASSAVEATVNIALDSQVRSNASSSFVVCVTCGALS